MQYSRSPLKQKQNQFKQFRNPFDNYYQKDYPNPFSKQLSGRKTSYQQKNYNDHKKRDQILLGPNCVYTKSQMIYEPQNNYQEKLKTQYTRTARNQNLSYLNSNKTQVYNEQRKFNAKQSEIETKINKIQNYQNKIQSLLQFIRTTTPKKINDMNESKTPSKSTSRFVTPVSSNKYKRRQPRNDKSQYVNQYAPQEITQPYNRKTQNPVKKFQIDQYGRRNRYFINQNQAQQQIRKKSRQFMKSVEGQVKQIKNTVYELNQKIKKVDNLQLPFKKQVILDLSSSNPVSKTSQIDPLQSHYQYQKQQNQRQNYYIQNYKQKSHNKHSENLNREKSISKLEQYKMRKRQRERQSDEIKNTIDINSAKKSGYIYNYNQ